MEILSRRAAGLDLETNNTKGPGSKRMHPAFGNKIVLMGFKAQDYDFTYGDRDGTWHPYGSGSGSYDVTGHNLKFDFGFLWHDTKGRRLVEDIIKGTVTVWDSQVAEYVNGNGLVSLENACIMHGIDFTKDDEIKEYWDKGFDTEDIPHEKLLTYLKGDVGASVLLHAAQRKAYKNHKLIYDMSRVSAVLAMIEQTGMYVDEGRLLAYAQGVYDRIAELDETVLKNIKSRGWPAEIEFSPNSAHHMEVLFFGGTLVTKEKQEVGVYKNGKPKFKQMPKDNVVSGSGNVGLTVPSRTKTGQAQFDDNWLKENAPRSEIVAVVQELRGLKKEASTFIEGIAANRHDKTGLLHGDFNNCITKTGRLSSSNPNLQNLTNQSKLKEVFTSRYGDDGWIVEIDYSQLEVIALACLTMDPVLLDDLRSGRDLHYETGKSVMGWRSESDMTKDERRTVKGVNFG